MAHAWACAQPGIASTLIGTRRSAHLDNNVKSLDVQLTGEDVSHLDGLTKPTFGFPQIMQPMFPKLHNGGTTMNGIHAPSILMQLGDKPY